MSTAREDGYSLMETMISSALFLLLIGGVSTSINSVRDHHHDASDRSDAQQTARIAMEQLQRDLQEAGVGLSRLQPPFPVVVPRDDGGIDLRVNPGQVTTFLTAPMASATADIPVDDVSGFTVGQQIGVYDALGNIDLTSVTALDASTSTIGHAGTSKPYDPADGAAVAVVRTVTYRAQDEGETWSLLRQIDGAGAAVVADNLDEVVFRYFDDSAPPMEFTPATLTQQLSIRVIEVRLDVRSQERLVGVLRPIVSLRARVTPRSLVLF